MNIQKGKLRESNIELLRIIAIIMIILHHITVHCVTEQFVGQAYFNDFAFYKKLIPTQTFWAFGKISNNIFVIITGYFLINKKINLSNQIKKILYQVCFVTPIIVLLSFLYYKFKDNSFIGVQSLNIFNSEYWFAGLYIFLIVFAELFLNKYLNKLNKNQYSVFLLFLFSVLSIYFLRSIVEQISVNFIRIISGVLFYALGGYIRIYKPFKNIRSIIIALVILLAFLGIWISFYNSTISYINLAKDNHTIFFQEFEKYDEYNVFCILISVGIFELFTRLKIPNSKIINYIASSTFITYLIHDTGFFENIWKTTNWVELAFNNYSKFILLHIKWVAIIMACGIYLFSLYKFLCGILDSNIIRKIIFKYDTTTLLNENNEVEKSREKINI